MNWVEDHIKFNLPLWIGISLLVITLSIWLFSIIELKSNEIMLAKDLPIEEVWRYEGALNWWKAFYQTIIIPTTSILSIVGIVSITSQHLIHRLTNKDPLNKFMVSLQQACEIDQD